MLKDYFVITGVRLLKGIKHILLGIAIILIGASFIISTDSSMGGYGEVIVIGLAQCIRGVKMDD